MWYVALELEAAKMSAAMGRELNTGHVRFWLLDGWARAAYPELYAEAPATARAAASGPRRPHPPAA